MDIFIVISLLGGLAMFLYGMRLMGDALKENSSGTLKRIMGKVTDNPLKAFILGVLVTALIQSSTATIVITAGLVGAGILTLHQSLGIIIGANVGTTVTGQIIRLLDIDSSGTQWLQFFKPSTLAPVALIIGMVLIMSGRPKGAKGVGNIAVGFGILFSGLLNMTGSVNNLASTGFFETLFQRLGNPVIGYLVGAGVAFMLQSSSATVGILQAFSASGMLQWNAIYSVIVGIYLGDCVTTAIVIYIGSKAEPRRVGIVNILFNLSETVLVLVVVTLLHKFGALGALWEKTVNSGIIANTNTIFNMGCSVALFPLLNTYERLARRIVHDDEEKKETSPHKDKLEALSPAFFDTPALALNSCYDLLLAIFTESRDNILRAMTLLRGYNKEVHTQILEREDDIDHMTDRVSRYSVELLPHLQSENHIAILNQYYKVTSEFERLGDHAVNIAENAANLDKNNTRFSDTAIEELSVLEEAIKTILADAELCFARRDLDAAYRIEPQVQVAGEIISQLKRNHLRRMSIGICNIYADASFTNLMIELKRIADVCSNIGVATVVRVQPELADHEHLYYESLHQGGNEAFDREYVKDYEKYFDRLGQIVQPEPPAAPAAPEQPAADGAAPDQRDRKPEGPGEDKKKKSKKKADRKREK